MSTAFQCECGKRLRLPEQAAGRKARCPACSRIFVVPAAETPEVENLQQTNADYSVQSDQPDEQPEEQPASNPYAQPHQHVRDEYDFADDSESAARASAMRAAATARAAAAKQKAINANAKIPPSRIATLSYVPTAANTRPYRYLILLLTLLPLAWITFKPEAHETVANRVVQTLKTHPDIESKLEELPENPTKEELMEVLPDHRFDGALLPYDTWMHWGFAALSAAGFFGAILLLFPPGHTRIVHLFFVGLFTGTLGILLLLALQWAAFHVPLRVGGGIITIVIDLIWLIGMSYRMALGDHNIVLSVLGFTAGVGFCEEACKALPLIWKARDSGFASWRSAMLWGLISGVGFGVSEGITYSHDSYNGIMGGQIYLVRFISCVALHGIWAAATGINVYRRQDHFRGNLHVLEWVMQVGITVIVPMILHGLYDTLLKQQYDLLALVVALASFGWLAWQIELAKKRHDYDPQPAVA